MVRDIALGAAAADPFPGRGHDHARCVDAAVENALALCERRGVRLTDLRRRVLELVWRSHAPVGAYDLLELLAAERGRVAPPTVYRALEFLAAQGLVHRLDTLNAFMGCARPTEGHAARFLICRTCRTAVEFADPAVDRAIAGYARGVGFEVAGETVEITGVCAACRAEPVPA